MAHALYLRGEYGRSLGMAENALIMKQGSYPISELFLHLSASMACMSLKDIDAAKAHFGAAWDIARPDGLIELIGEHHGLLQGLIEACLKTQYPDDFARIIGLHTYSQSPRRCYDIQLTGKWATRGGFRFEEFILTPRREDADHGRTE